MEIVDMVIGGMDDPSERAIYRNNMVDSQEVGTFAVF